MGTLAWRPVVRAGRLDGLPLRLQPSGRTSARLARVGMAVGATAAAALAQRLLLPQPVVAPFVFFFLAVAVAAWLFGRGAGLLTTLLSALTAHWLYLAPFGQLKLTREALAATVLFVAGAGPIALLCGMLRDRLVAAQRAARELAEETALHARSAAAAREAEERFRLLADSMPQLVWTARPDGSVEYYNQRTSLFAGFERAADGTWTWSPAVHPEDLARTVAAWGHAVATGGAYEVEHRVQMADGTYRWHLSRGVPVHDERGHLVRWYGTATDIHAHKRATEALAESDRHKTEFLGVLSHELRNPLAPIRNSLHVAARATPGSDPHRRALAVIERQVGQLNRLVDDLLDVTRIARGKVHLVLRRVDLAAVARQVVEDHRDLFARQGIELSFQAPGEELPVVADAARLAQVIGNLLQNAAKFSPRGGRATVAVRALDDRLAAVSVQDTGRGIRPEVLERLFEPFVQAEPSQDRGMGGLGLGLALVRGLVQLHGGTVTADSAGEGRGARFTATLPRERRRAVRAAPPEAPRPGPAPRRVLVVEDNRDAAETLKDALELDGHSVELAYTGLDGVEKARALRPDAVICDIGLPGMSGFEVARALRADPALASTTLIALSGYALADDVEQARSAGFDRHQAKPPDLDELGRWIVAADRAGAAPPP